MTLEKLVPTMTYAEKAAKRVLGVEDGYEAHLQQIQQAEQEIVGAINSAMQAQREACAGVSLAWHCVAVTSQDFAKYPELNHQDVHQAILNAEVKL